jgi:hypothetical protein
MPQVYMQLLAEFKRMGATVVYASMNSIIIATTKTTADDALAYVNYITESIKCVPHALESHPTIGFSWLRDTRGISDLIFFTDLHGFGFNLTSVQRTNTTF